MSERTKDLVQIIRDNPNAFALIDNDSWYLFREEPANNPHMAALEPEGTGEEMQRYEAWEENNTLASDSDVIPLGGGGYGSGNRYGGDILQALAQIVGLKVESV